MLKSIVLALILVNVYCGPKHYELEGYTFEQYKKDFNKYYLLGSDEHTTREQNFLQRMEEIRVHNADETQTWKKGINKFSDLTQEEFERDYLGHSKNMALGWNQAARKFLELPPSKIDRSDLPDSIDWRDHGAVTPVKDQGRCGSCWAFAAIETIESIAAIENSGRLLELSAQQLTSCTSNELKCGGTGGCSGCIAQLAFSYGELFQITTEEAYPYTSGTTGSTGSCDYVPGDDYPTVVRFMGHRTLPFNDQNHLDSTLANHGPVSISAYASTWSTYESGIFTGCPYDGNIAVNHAIQLVGYTADTYIIRNSWGSGWGEDGYIRFPRDAEAQCGTNTSPLDGAACVGDGQTTQTVCGMCGMHSNSAIPLEVTIN